MPPPFRFSTRLLCKDQPVAFAMPAKPTTPPYSALLLGSPGETMLGSQNEYTPKTTKDGSRTGLHGVLRDLMLARAFLIQNMYDIFECLHATRLFKSEVLGALTMFFSQERAPRHFVVYFSGHGNKHTGNWVFTDGEISLHEVYDLFVRFAPPESGMSVVADCCHSGAWVEQTFSCPDDFDTTRFAIQAACLKEEVCWDTKVGGLFTKSWVSGSYHRLARRKVREHRGRAQIEDLSDSLKSTFASWLPWRSESWNSSNCGFLSTSLLSGCSKECTSMFLDNELESAQHPIATHPYACNLVFYDHERFNTMEEEARFPRDEATAVTETTAELDCGGASFHDTTVSSFSADANLSVCSIEDDGDDMTAKEMPPTQPPTRAKGVVAHPVAYIDLRNFWLGGS